MDASDEIHDEDNEGRPLPRTNSFAWISLILGWLSLFLGPMAGLPALAFGTLGRLRARRLCGLGRRAALTGMWLAVICSALNIIVLRAIVETRAAASKSDNLGRFKQLGLAVITDDQVNGIIPSAVYDPMDVNLPAGFGLSWRVGVMIHMDEALYKSFTLSQAWNSPANLPSANTFVGWYHDHEDPKGPPLTRFCAFVGTRTAFDPAKRISIESIPDGSSATILFADANALVPWASPQDIPYTPNEPLPKLGHPNRDVLFVCLADYSVRSFEKTIDPKVLHKLIMVDDGVPTDWDK